MWPWRRGAGRGGGKAGEGGARFAARLPAIIALVRESRGRVEVLLLGWLESIVVEVRVIGLRRRGTAGLFCIEDVRRRSGFGGEGARLDAGIRDRFSTLAAGSSSPLVGELARGERVDDADTKLSSDETGLADVRLKIVGAAGSACLVSACTVPSCSSDVGVGEALNSCTACLSDGCVTVLKLSTVALGRTAGGCKLGFEPSLLGVGESISVVAARRMT